MKTLKELLLSIQERDSIALDQLTERIENIESAIQAISIELPHSEQCEPITALYAYASKLRAKQCQLSLRLHDVRSALAALRGELPPDALSIQHRMKTSLQYAPSEIAETY